MLRKTEGMKNFLFKKLTALVIYCICGYTFPVAFLFFVFRPVHYVSKEIIEITKRVLIIGAHFLIMV